MNLADLFSTGVLYEFSSQLEIVLNDLYSTTRLIPSFLLELRKKDFVALYRDYFTKIPSA